MPRDYKVFLEDILEAIEKVLKYTVGLSQGEFFQDEKTLDFFPASIIEASLA